MTQIPMTDSSVHWSEQPQLPIQTMRGALATMPLMVLTSFDRWWPFDLCRVRVHLSEGRSVYFATLYLHQQKTALQAFRCFSKLISVPPWIRQREYGLQQCRGDSNTTVWECRPSASLTVSEKQNILKLHILYTLSLPSLLYSLYFSEYSPCTG